MKKVLVLCILAFPQLLFSQDQGIAFENQLTWQQVLQKAKAQNKFIFVDCYASWCGPCKWMDQNVYVNDTVGDFMNKAFIAVKVQMDSTPHDNAAVKSWYPTGHELSEQYLIVAYPTYLFFSPDGQAVHKATGLAKIQSFLALAEVAMDPRRQYYTLLAEYRRDSLQYALMPGLANASREVQEDDLSDRIALDYIHYLEQLTDANLWTKDNIVFIGSYANVFHYGDKIFSRYFHERIKIDSIMGSTAYTWRLINAVAYHEDVKPRIEAGLKYGSEPNWHLMEKTIQRRYGNTFVQKNMLMGREEYYRAAKAWEKYARYFVIDMKRINIENQTPGLGASMAINNSAFEVFKYSKSRKELKEALSWIDKALSMNYYQAQELDTKANLLYKLGKNKEALLCEEKSNNLDPLDKELKENYERMKNGQPTW